MSAGERHTGRQDPELLRVEFRVVVLDRNDDGQPVGERTAEGVVYAAALDQLPDSIRQTVTQAGAA